MPYPLAYRTRRIVFLLALLFPTATLGYIAFPHGDILLRNAATARTQDIQIDNHLPALRRLAFMAAPAPLIDPRVGARTPLDDAALDELALAMASAPGALAYAPSGVAGGSGGDNSGGGASHVQRRGSSSDAAFSGHGMAGAGGWGGAVGVASTRTGDDSVGVARVKTQRAARPARPAASSTRSGRTTRAPSTGGTTGAAPLQVAQNVAGAAPGLTVALATQGLSTAGSVPSVTSVPKDSSPAPTPEPVTFVLMGGGLAAVFAGRRFVR